MFTVKWNLQLASAIQERDHAYALRLLYRASSALEKVLCETVQPKANYTLALIDSMQ